MLIAIAVSGYPLAGEKAQLAYYPDRVHLWPGAHESRGSDAPMTYADDRMRRLRLQFDIALDLFIAQIKTSFRECSIPMALVVCMCGGGGGEVCGASTKGRNTRGNEVSKSSLSHPAYRIARSPASS